MRVTNNSITDQFVSRLQDLTGSLQDATNQLSSGQRIHKSSDDPTSASRVLALQSDQRAFTQYQSNIDRGTEINAVVYDNANSIKDLITRTEELAVGIDDMTAPEEYTAIIEELNQLIEQGLDTANAKYSNNYVFAGNATDTQPFTATRDANNDITAISYVGSANVASFEISEGTTLTPYSTPTQNTEIETALNNMIGLRDALVARDTTAVTAVRGALETDEDTIINQLSSHAAVQARLETASSQQKTYADALDERISGEADIDISEATVRYNEIYLAYQAALTAGSKMLSQSLLDYM